MAINQVIEKIMTGNVIIKDQGDSWKISSLGRDFLDWMRINYKEQEDVTWQLWYYSGSMAIIQVIDEKMMTMINLRWR